MRYYAASAGAGFLQALCFLPLGLDFLAWIAIVPLFWALAREQRPLATMAHGAVFGATFFLVDISWVYHTLRIHGHFTVLPALLTFLSLVAILSAFPTIFAYLCHFFHAKGFAISSVAPFLWIGLEYVRGQIFTGFPWDLLGYSQTARLHLIQFTDLTGIYGVSFLILLVNIAIFESLEATMRKDRLPVRLIGASAIAVVLVFIYGELKLKEFPHNPKLATECSIGVLQGNIPQENKWDDRYRDQTFRTYEKLGAEAKKAGAQLLIWPETSVPAMFGTTDSDCQRPSEISQRLSVPMVIGAPSAEVSGGQIAYFNSAFLIDGPFLRQQYSKMHLVPFGEYMPFSWLLPLGPGIAAREADYSPGESMTVMTVNDCPRFSVLICYEAIFPELARLAVREGAQLLVNITNDGWFGDTAAPYQHLAMAKVRSVENRTWLVRSANTGISAAFDPAGRMMKNIPLQQEGFFVITVPQNISAGSFYTYFGDVFAFLCIGICGFLFGSLFLRRSKT